MYTLSETKGEQAVSTSSFQAVDDPGSPDLSLRERSHRLSNDPGGAEDDLARLTSRTPFQLCLPVAMRPIAQDCSG